MKTLRYYYSILVFIISLFLSCLASAQSSKIAYVNLQYIYNNLPASKKAKIELNSLSSSKKAILDSKAKAISQKKHDHYNGDPSKITSELVAALNTKTEHYEQLAVQSQEEVYKKQKVLFDDIDKIIKAAICKVAEENN
jgi:Skp family chaperone for outer membrane proteins